MAETGEETEKKKPENKQLTKTDDELPLPSRSEIVREAEDINKSAPRNEEVVSSKTCTGNRETSQNIFN